MNTFFRGFSALIIMILIFVAWDGFYIIPEGSQVVVTQLGRPVGTPKTEAGLEFKVPLIQKTEYFDKRIQIWDGKPNQISTNDKTFVYLDVTARWRIVDALAFLQAVNEMNKAQGVLDGIIDGSVRDLVNKNDLVEIIRSSDWTIENMSRGVESDDATVKLGRDKISTMIHEAASKVTPQYGIELVDVMFKRVNYIEKVRLKVYERMISERKRIAAEKRSMGEGLKAEILGKVTRELKEILSKANREAEEVKGKADAEAAGIYANAYNRDAEFYGFWKSLEAYASTVGKNTQMILSSDAEFYKFIESSK